MAIHDWSRVDVGVFHDFHLVWIGRLKGILNEELLPRPFYAIAEPLLGEAEPGVIALHTQTEPSSSPPGPLQGSKHVHSDTTEGAVALAPWPVVVEDIVPDPYARRSRRIAIKDAWQGDRVVTVIEIVSYGNKSSRARVEQFLRKSVSLLERRIHLVVLDLHAPTALVPKGFHAMISGDLGHEASGVSPERPLSAVSYQILETGALRAHFVPLRVGDRLRSRGVPHGARVRPFAPRFDIQRVLPDRALEVPGHPRRRDLNSRAGFGAVACSRDRRAISLHRGWQSKS